MFSEVTEEKPGQTSQALESSQKTSKTPDHMWKTNGINNSKIRRAQKLHEGVTGHPTQTQVEWKNQKSCLEKHRQQKERKVSGDVEEMGATCPLKAQHRRAKPG